MSSRNRSLIRNRALAWLTAMSIFPIAAVAGPVFTVNTTTTGDQRAPDVASDINGHYVITWQGPDGDGDGIFARRYAADGSPIGTEFAVNTRAAGEQTAPNVAFDASGRFAISYTSTAADGRAWLEIRRYTAAGVAIDPAPRRVPVSFTRHELAIDSSGIAIFAGLFEGTDGRAAVRFRRFRFDGVAVGPEVEVEDVNPFFRRPPPGVCTTDDGAFALVYTRAGGEGDLRLKRYASNGELQGTTAFGWRSDGTSDPARIACLSGGGYVSAHTRSDLGSLLQAGVVITRFDDSGTVLGDFEVDDTIDLPGMGNTANASSPALAADPAGGFAVVWTHLVITRGDDENPEAFDTRLKGRRYAASGAPTSTILRIDTPAPPSRATAPSLALSARNSVATWFEGEVTPVGALSALDVLARQLP